MRISLADHFTYKKLLKFVFPSLIMMITMSLYIIIDGIFISNFVGKNAFAAVNLVMPIILGIVSFGYMIGAGGSALVAKTFGEGNDKLANRYFSMFIIYGAIIGLVLSSICFIFMPQISRLLGASDLIIEDCIIYGRILMVSNAMYLLQSAFQNFMVVAEKPRLGLAITLISGCTNIVLDFIFICIFNWSIWGAAVATAIAQTVGAVIPIIYFFNSKGKSRLYFRKPIFDIKAIIKGSTNGMSELISNVSMCIVSVLYNLVLIKVAQENGVAAFGVIMYLSFVFTAIFYGYVMGTAPIISFHYGAENTYELQNLFKKSVIINIIASIVMTTLAVTLASPISQIFVGYDKELFDLTVNGMRLYSIGFLIMGLNIFSSGFFTALNDGYVSGVISVLRTLVFQIITILIMPLIWGINGIWLALVVAEILSLIVSIYYFVTRRKIYHYI